MTRSTILLVTLSAIALALAVTVYSLVTISPDSPEPVGSDAVVERQTSTPAGRPTEPVEVLVPEASDSADADPEQAEPSIIVERPASTHVDFADDDIFASMESLEGVFIDSSGRVSQGALTSALQHSDFDSFVTKINRVEANGFATEQEEKISQQLIEVFGSDVYQSNYACSERICAVTFTSTTAIDPERLAQFSAFGSHYRFTRLDNNARNEDILKAIYIYTNNESELVFSDN